MTDETNTTIDEGKQPEPDKTPNETPKPDGQGSQPESERTFTQQELNDIVTGRLSKKEKAIVDELGMTIEEAKKQLKVIKDKEDAEKSEIQRLTEDLDNWKRQTKEAQEREARIKRESRIKDIASELQFQDPSDAITFLDQSKIETDDNGNVTNAKPLLSELADNKPYLIKKASGYQNPANPGDGRKTLTESERLRKYDYHVPKR